MERADEAAESLRDGEWAIGRLVVDLARRNGSVQLSRSRLPRWRPRPTSDRVNAPWARNLPRF